MRTRTYRLGSLTFAVSTDTSVTAGRVLHRLLTPLRERGTPTHRYELKADREDLIIGRDGELIHRSLDAFRALDRLLWEINSDASDAVSHHLLLHAGAVSSRGRGIVISAPPDSGKSTLTAALVAAGMDYVGDEIVPVDVETGLLQPHPRPVWVQPPSLDALEGLRDRVPAEYHEVMQAHYHFRPTDLRPTAVTVTRPTPVGLVIRPHYVAGSPTHVREMSGAETVMLLARENFNLERHGGRGVELLGRIVDAASCYELTYGDTEGAVSAVNRMASRLLSEELDVAEGQVEVLA